MLPIHVAIVLELGMGAQDLATDPALILNTAPAVRVELHSALIQCRQLALHIVKGRGDAMVQLVHQPVVHELDVERMGAILAIEGEEERERARETARLERTKVWAI